MNTVMRELTKLAKYPERYRKFFTALTAAAGVLLLALAPIGSEAAFHVTTTEWYQVVVAFAGAYGVYQIRNGK